MSRAILICLISGIFSVGAACLAESAATTGAGQSGFVDITATLGLDYHVKSDPEGGEAETDRPDREDGGLALVDIDNDGRLELYVAHGHGETGRLFSYDGSRFTRLAGNRGIDPAGMDRAGYFIDLDHDGRQDVVSITSSRTGA